MDYTARAARWLLGATDHPGGEALTRHLLDRLGLAPGSLVVDVACGRGATLELLRAAGHLAVGVDVEPRQVRGVPVAVVGDAHHLPLPTGAYDAVLIECSLSTFDVPARVLAEVARVLRPGGRLGMTDVVLHRELAPRAVTAAVDRLTAARTLPAYQALLAEAGLTVMAVEDRGQDARALLRRLRTRLPLSRTLRACAQAARSGTLGYGLLVAERPS